MRKTRQMYVYPTCDVVELHVTNQPIASSPVEGERKGYGDAEDDDWN